jgi:serine/threonine protein kinase
MLASMVGTPQYLAPEVVMQSNQNPGYENVVDCWSVGIIVYRCGPNICPLMTHELTCSMLTKALPFDEDANLPVDVSLAPALKVGPGTDYPEKDQSAFHSTVRRQPPA